MGRPEIGDEEAFEAALLASSPVQQLRTLANEFASQGFDERQSTTDSRPFATDCGRTDEKPTKIR